MIPYDLDYQAISASAIKAAILRREATADECELSMLHMRHAITKPRGDDGTPAMRWGTIAHCAILEPDRLAVWPGERRAGSEYKAFADANEGRCIVSTPELSRAMAVRDAVIANAAARFLVSETEHETPIQWIDPALGRCKGKPDMFADGVVADLKLLRDASPCAINAAIYRAGTDIQLAWYIRGMRAAGLCGQFVRARVIAVESAPPHACVVVDIPPQFIESAEALAIEIAQRYRVHEACGSFPGPARETMTYEPPRWATSNEDWAPTEGDEGL